MFNPAIKRITDTDNNHKRKADDVSKDPNEAPMKEEQLLHTIQWSMDSIKYWFPSNPTKKNQLLQERDELFHCVTRCYIDPLVQLIKQNACNIYVSKRILWFLYPDYHMDKGVSFAYTELEKKLFA